MTNPTNTGLTPAQPVAPAAATKLVEVRLSALTRVEYSEIIEVPVDTQPRQLSTLVDERYDQVDGGDYKDDPEYWVRATCEVVPSDMPGAQPSLILKQGTLVRTMPEMAPKIKLEGDRAVFIESYATGNHDVRPCYAALTVDQAFLKNLQDLSALCKDRGLSEVRLVSSPDTWEGEDDLQLTDPELIVTKSSFWFTDKPKHSDGSIETRGQAIEAFTAKVLAQPKGERLVLSENEKLAAKIDEDYDNDQPEDQPTAG